EFGSGRLPCGRDNGGGNSGCRQGRDSGAAANSHRRPSTQERGGACRRGRGGGGGGAGIGRASDRGMDFGARPTLPPTRVGGAEGNRARPNAAVVIVDRALELMERSRTRWKT